MSDYAHYDWFNVAPVHFIKEHQWREDLSQRADVILTSFRATEEVESSWLRYEGTALAPADLRGHLGHLQRWMAEADSVMNHADLVQHEEVVIERLAHDLRHVLGSEAVARDLFHVKQKLHAIAYPNRGEPPHPVALYRWNHRAGS